MIIAKIECASKGAACMATAATIDSCGLVMHTVAATAASTEVIIKMIANMSLV